MDKNKKTERPASFSLIATGVVLIALWLFSARPWENSPDNELSFFIDGFYSALLLPILPFGMYLLGLGLLRLLHASWDKKNKIN